MSLLRKVLLDINSVVFTKEYHKYAVNYKSENIFRKPLTFHLVEGV